MTKNLNSSQRFQTALKSGRPDMIPIWENNIVESSIIELFNILTESNVETVNTGFGYHRSDELMELYATVAEKLDFDATSSHFTNGLKEIKPGIVEDKYGVIFQLSSHGEPVVIEGPIKEPGDIKKFEMASKVSLDEDFLPTQYLLNRFGNTKSHVLDILDPYKTSWYLRGGMDKLLMDYYLNPQLVHDMARVATDHCMAIVEMGVKLGVDTIAMIGDVSGLDAPSMSPDHFAEFIQPYEKEIVKYAHERGLTVIKHSDGNLWPIMDQLVDAGFDGLHPIQPQSMEIAEVKEKYAGKICLLGNIDCQEILCTGSIDEVRSSVKETIDIAAPDGGFVICSSNSIHSDVNSENYIAMIDETRKHRKYD